MQVLSVYASIGCCYEVFVHPYCRRPIVSLKGQTHPSLSLVKGRDSEYVAKLGFQRLRHDLRRYI